MFTGAKTEAPWCADADLLILYGVDPVELFASPWPYDDAVLELAETEIRPHYTDMAASLFGRLSSHVRSDPRGTGAGDANVNDHALGP